MALRDTSLPEPSGPADPTGTRKEAVPTTGTPKPTGTATGTAKPAKAPKAARAGKAAKAGKAAPEAGGAAKAPKAAGESTAATAGTGAPAGTGSPAALKPPGPAPSPGVPAAAPAPTPVPAPATPVRAAPALSPGDRERLLSGAHHDPHALLGAHPVPGGVVFRALRPFARAVSVRIGERRYALASEGEGLFSGVVPLPQAPAYTLVVAYDGEERECHDPYRFLPALGELDLHLIREGRHEQLWKALGAEPMTHQGVTGTRFTVWAPHARGVRVAGDFCFWDGTAHPMRSLGASGVWELFLPGIGEGARYKFEITARSGDRFLKADPMARRCEVPPDTASIVHTSHYTWGDEDWLAHRDDLPVHEAPFSVYEVHLPSWRPGLTYRELAEQLPAYVRDLGFTHVELMPIAEHPFGGSWGYQVTGCYAPTSRLGTPDDFKFLVDALHRAGIGVILDWVPAHFPKDDWALARFDGEPLYEPGDARRAEHPDWGTLEFDFGRVEVRNFLVANAVYWCEEFHLDGLRVDAVASMLYLDYSRDSGQWTPNVFGGREDLDAVAFLQEMNATVYRRVPGVVTIAEESTAWDGVTRPTDSGGLGFGLKWNMGWMHDSLQYMAHEPVHRTYHHHEMTFSMVYAYSENYVLPISHDEVVHGKRSLVSKMPGDWWQQRASHRAYLAFMWAHPGKQLLFMGQEFAQGAEWSEATGPDWWLLERGYGAEADHRGVRDLVRDLNSVYRSAPSLWERDTDPAGFEWLLGDAAEDNVFAFVRRAADGTPLISVSNFSPVVRHGYRLPVRDGVAAWTEALNTDAARYGGGAVVNAGPLTTEGGGLTLTLPPLATVWLRPV